MRRTVRTGRIIALWCAVACLPAAPLMAQQDAADEPGAVRAQVKDRDGAPELTRDASKAIDDGLKYLLKIQQKDGSWNGGRGNFAMASTSLALMAFMVKGEFPGQRLSRRALAVISILGEAPHASWKLRRARGEAMHGGRWPRTEVSVRA